jgi:ribose-phosphate pyrophosphokinase
MKTLNLVNLEQSDIKYKPQKFPDGQQNIVLLSDNDQYEDRLFELKHGMSVNIKSRLNNWRDLELIVAAVASLRELSVEEIHLYTPYFVGARSDRKFEEGGNNYIKHVIAPVINSLGFKTVTILDPHSDVLEACVNGFKKLNNSDLVRYALIHQNNLDGVKAIVNSSTCILMAPDAGASKKIYKLAKDIGYTGPIIVCDKERDIDGNIIKTIVPLKSDLFDYNEDIIIIDDICDGGRTFIEIAKEIEEYFSDPYKNGWQPKKYLIVTHGIFSAGFKELGKYFDGIYCTNSYRDVADNEYEIKTNIKQLNVF